MVICIFFVRFFDIGYDESFRRIEDETDLDFVSQRATVVFIGIANLSTARTIETGLIVGEDSFLKRGAPKG